MICALAECEVEFIPQFRRQVCCSQRHGKIHYNRVSRADGRQKTPEWDERRRAQWKARQAQMKGLDAEVFEFREIFERDGWICGLCREPVDASLVWPDDMSPSLDHVVPLSLGGAHVRSNVQLAHLGCNVRKGARAA